MLTVASFFLSRLSACARLTPWWLAALIASPLALQATEPLFQVRKTITEADFGSATSNVPMVLSGLSATGDLAGYYMHASKSGGVTVYSLHSFVWQDATTSVIDLYNQMSADSSIATCMSPSGVVGGVAWGLGNANQAGYVWRNGVMTTFPSPNGGDIDAVVGVNDSGYAIGTYFGAGTYKRAFLWNGTTSVDLGDFGDSANAFIWPASINNGGQVVGTVYDFSQAATSSIVPSSAFLWQNGAMSLLDPSGDYEGTAAVGINGLGQTACSYRSHLRDGGGGFFWEDGVLTELGDLGGGGVVPFAILIPGTVIGTAYDSDDVLHVFRWQSGVMTDLGGVSLDAADTAFQLTGVNTAGNVVGFVTNDVGVTKGVWRSVSAAGSLLHDVAAMLPGGTGFVADDTPGTSILVNEAGRTACSGFIQGTPAVLLLLPDTDGDGMPDEWETAHDLNPLDPNDASADPDGDGKSNWVEYWAGTDPHNYYNGLAPVLTVVGGGNQRVAPDNYLPQSLSVQVDGGAYNAPLTLTVTSGSALFVTGNTTSTSVHLRTTTEFTPAGSYVTHVAQVSMYLPAGNSISTITITADTGDGTTSIQTTAIASNPNLQPPGGIGFTANTATTVDLVWTPSDLSLSTAVEISKDYGATWEAGGTFAPGATSATLYHLTPDCTNLIRFYTVHAAVGGEISSNNNSLASTSAGADSDVSDNLQVQTFSVPVVAGKWIWHQNYRDSFGGLQPGSANRYLTRTTDGQFSGPGYSIIATALAAWDPYGGTISLSGESDFYNGWYRTGTANWVITGDTRATSSVSTVYGDLASMQFELSQPYSLEQFIADSEAGYPHVQTDDQFVDGACAASMSLSTAWNNDRIYDPFPCVQGSDYRYSCFKLEYKFHCNVDPHGRIVYDILFTPDDGGPVVHDIHVIPTDGKTLIDAPDILDPSKLNGKKNGVYRVVPIQLQPDDWTDGLSGGGQSGTNAVGGQPRDLNPDDPGQTGKKGAMVDSIIKTAAAERHFVSPRQSDASPGASADPVRLRATVRMN